VSGAVLACACSIGVWGWNELLFLTGIVTGPNRSAPAAALQGGARFRAAAASVLHHELALAASLIAVAAVTLPGGNLVGLWTFLILWIMRLSAKLNIFLGVPNPGLQFLPDHLAYLGGHFRSGPVGAFFAVSTTAATAALATIVAATALSDGGDFEATAATLLSTLLALAIVEHWFLALPLPTERLWGIGRRVRPSPPPDLPTTLRSLARIGAKA
jgi:putative photosynthetic complex assembly protein 2